jgi:pilus assembly protein CpaF
MKRMPSVDDIFKKTTRHFLTPVAAYLDDPAVSEIMINGPAEVYVENAGKLVKTDAKFPGEAALRTAIVNVLQYAGKRLDPDHPMVEARLPDGSRVHVALDPCSRRGPVMTIRKHLRSFLSIVDLIKIGTISAHAAEYLKLIVLLEKNLLVSGGTASGKTTLLNIVSAFIPGNRRIVVIEDTTELKLMQTHVVPMEARRPDRYGKGEVTIRELFNAALRMRPDRIIVGECRGPEALDMIQAMTSGHAGSMSTIHANTPYDALGRLETMVLMSGVTLPLFALRNQIASAIQVIVQIARLSDGSRRITDIAEVLPAADDAKYRLQTIFTLRPVVEAGVAKGVHLDWTGTVSAFARDPALAAVAGEIKRNGRVFGMSGQAAAT